ncbi:MAG: peptidoglycan recognition protein [Sandaracinaceae bacterium]|nr:peptidoglycan recognition protein [Sandaracinaceae bacterium]
MPFPNKQERVVFLLYVLWAFAGVGGCVNHLSGDGASQDDEGAEAVYGREELLSLWTSDGEWLLSPPLDAPDGVSRVGVWVELEEEAPFPHIEARSAEGAQSGAWLKVEPTFSEGDTHVGIVDVPIGDGAQLRIRRDEAMRIREIRWNAVIPEIPSEESGEELGESRMALSRELSDMGIVTREAWGARRTRCSERDGTKVRFSIHHTVTPASDPLRRVRSIQAYHMDSRGWCDIGYHFLIGYDGTIYEGRPLHLLGTHTAYHNSQTIGISFIGCFHSSGCNGFGPNRPSEAMIEAGGRLLGRLAEIYGISLNRHTVRGHREFSYNDTSCPGDYMMARMNDLVAIGRAAQGGVGSPPPSSPPPSSSGRSCRHSYGGIYVDRGCSNSYQCCDGTWRSRGACGACVCVDPWGERGCGR